MVGIGKEGRGGREPPLRPRGTGRWTVPECGPLRCPAGLPRMEPLVGGREWEEKARMMLVLWVMVGVGREVAQGQLWGCEQ